MDENMTLLIDPESRDLVFDEDGSFRKIYDKDTTVQNVRHALSTWKEEFFADPSHGTDYESVVAVFQEPDVQRVDSIAVSYDRRTLIVQVSATLTDGENIALEVTA